MTLKEVVVVVVVFLLLLSSSSLLLVLPVVRLHVLLSNFLLFFVLWCSFSLFVPSPVTRHPNPFLTPRDHILPIISISFFSGVTRLSITYDPFSFPYPFHSSRVTSPWIHQNPRAPGLDLPKIIRAQPLPFVLAQVSFFPLFVAGNATYKSPCLSVGWLVGRSRFYF